MRLRLPSCCSRGLVWVRDYPVTAGLLAVYSGMYFACLFAQGGIVRLGRQFELLPIEIGTLIDFGALTTRAVGVAAEPWRLVTATLLHAGLVHLFFNGFALFEIGAWIEEWFGGAVLLTLHFLFGLAGNIVSILFHAHNVEFAQVGASGALFGLIAFMAVVSRQSKQLAAKGAFAILVAWIALSLALGWAIGADNAAHLGGAFAGTIASLFAFVFRPGLMPKGALRISALLSAGVFLLAFGLQARGGIASHRARIELARLHRRMAERNLLTNLELELQAIDTLCHARPLSLEDVRVRARIATYLDGLGRDLSRNESARRLCQLYIEALGGPDGSQWKLADGLNALAKLKPAHETWAATNGFRSRPAPIQL